MFTLAQEPIIQEVKLVRNPREIRLYIKREDMIHPVISGNKWRKLKYNFEQAKKEGYKTILTFGGAYSNHIHATAGAARQHGFRSIGIIRGEEHLPLNPTLKEAKELGMDLFYLDRSSYRDKHNHVVINDLNDLFGHFYLVPEGGTNVLAVKGAAEIVEGITKDYDYVVAACGTGGTISGIISGLKGNAEALGIAVLKGDFLIKDVKHLLEESGHTDHQKWRINNDYHFGGYAKFNQELVRFINEFRQSYKVPLDPVYTGKMMFGVMDLIKNDYFPKESRVLAIHTGGLQGTRGFNQRFGNLIDL